ncbi:hypothetical protein Ndes2437B_g00729 [Nannochloris sp. 'desiccata']|nr:hypothetical protein KSW81_000117 [Chlorella desiccata (nom. nud.)]
MQPLKLTLLVSCLVHVALDRRCGGGFAAAARILQQQEQPFTPPQVPIESGINLIETTAGNSTGELLAYQTNQTELEEEGFPIVPSSELLVTSASETFPTEARVQYLRPEDAIQIPGQPNYATNSGNHRGTGTGLADPLLPTSQPRTAGGLISLLQPLPAESTFSAPSLNETQLANIPQLQEMRQGIATVTYQRSVSNYDGVNMNCGTGYLNDYFKDHFVGVSLPLYGTGEVCGACVQVHCVDAACNAPLLANRTFMVVDSCKECIGNDLVISAPGYLALSGVNFNINPSIHVAWRVTSCAPLLSGGIRMLPSRTNSPVFVGLNFSNSKVLLQSVVINGMSMQRTDFGSWVIDSPGRNIPLTPPYALQLRGVNGQVVAVRVAGLVPQDLGVNFD